MLDTLREYVTQNNILGRTCNDISHTSICPSELLLKCLKFNSTPLYVIEARYQSVLQTEIRHFSSFYELEEYVKSTSGGCLYSAMVLFFVTLPTKTIESPTNVVATRMRIEN